MPVTSLSTTGNLRSPALSEISGIVPSRKHKGVLWAHNDSGHAELLFAIHASGKLVRRYRLKSARCVDWEDIALGREHPGGPDVLFIADTGTNLSKRARTTIYVVPEPDPSQGGDASELVLDGARAVLVRYADETPRDVETLLFDDRDSALYFVTKTTTGMSEVYRSPVPLADDNILEKVATIATPSWNRRGSERTTGGDISVDGSRILVRTYTQAYLWTRAAGQSVADAMQADPCQPYLVSEPQGEAIAFAVDGSGFFTISEGAGRPIYFHAFGGHPSRQR